MTPHISSYYRHVEPAKFVDVPLSAQVRILTGMAFSAHGAMTWWADPARVWTSEEAELNARTQVDDSRLALMSICRRLNQLSHYAEGVEIEVEFDESYAGEEKSVHARAAVTSHPFAWAKAALVQTEAWPFNEEYTLDSAPTELIMYNFSKVADKMAAKILAKWVIEIYSEGEISTNDRSADDIFILQLSTGLQTLRKNVHVSPTSRVHRFITDKMNGAYLHTKYVEGEKIEEKYTSKEIREMLEEIDERIELEMFKNELKHDSRQIKQEAKEMQKSALRIASILETLAGMKNLPLALKERLVDRANISDEDKQLIKDTLI